MASIHRRIFLDGAFDSLVHFLSHVRGKKSSVAVKSCGDCLSNIQLNSFRGCIKISKLGCEI